MRNHVCSSLFGFIILLLMQAGLATADVPKLMNYQGKATDASGNPVPDGSHSFYFMLYTSPSGATLLWIDDITLQTTDGLFSYMLGSDPAAPLADSIFNKYDSLFLGVMVDGEMMTPLTPLCTAPYAMRVNSINSAKGGLIQGNLELVDSLTGTKFVKLKQGTNSSGLLQIQKSPTEGGVTIDGNAGTSPWVYMNGADVSLAMDLGAIGNNVVLFPGNAISALEQCNEPGVGSYINETGYDATSGLTYLGSRAMFSPSAGYVLVIASAQVSISHTLSFTDGFYFGVTDDCGMLYQSSKIYVGIPSSYPTGSLSLPITVHGLFPVDSGTTTFCFMAEQTSADCHVENITISELFVPTSYTTVISPVAPPPNNDAASERAREISDHQALLQAELDKMKADMAAMKDKMEALESQSIE